MEEERPSVHARASDESLMARYVSGDAQAFDVLFSRYRGPLFRYLLHSLRGHSAAEDVFQETFMRVIKGRRSYRDAGTFRAWLFTVARNALIDRHRRARVRPDTLFGPHLVELNEEDAVLSADHSDLTALQVREALARIPEEQREVFLLREEAGLDFRAIADMTGCSVGTAKSRMRYALERLREALAVPDEKGIG